MARGWDGSVDAVLSPSLALASPHPFAHFTGLSLLLQQLLAARNKKTTDRSFLSFVSG